MDPLAWPGVAVAWAKQVNPETSSGPLVDCSHVNAPCVTKRHHHHHHHLATEPYKQHPWAAWHGFNTMVGGQNGGQEVKDVASRLPGASLPPCQHTEPAPACPRHPPRHLHQHMQALPTAASASAEATVSPAATMATFPWGYMNQAPRVNHGGPASPHLHQCYLPPLLPLKDASGDNSTEVKSLPPLVPMPDGVNACSTPNTPGSHSTTDSTTDTASHSSSHLAKMTPKCPHNEETQMAHVKRSNSSTGASTYSTQDCQYSSSTNTPREGVLRQPVPSLPFPFPPPRKSSTASQRKNTCHVTTPVPTCSLKAQNRRRPSQKRERKASQPPTEPKRKRTECLEPPTPVQQSPHTSITAQTTPSPHHIMPHLYYSLPQQPHYNPSLQLQQPFPFYNNNLCLQSYQHPGYNHGHHVEAAMTSGQVLPHHMPPLPGNLSHCVYPFYT